MFPNLVTLLLTIVAAGQPTSVSLLLHMDGSDAGTTFTDSSSYNHTMTVNGTETTSTTEKKFGTASLKLAGSPSTVDLHTTVDSTFQFGTGDFTWEGFVFLSSTSGRAINIFGAGTTNGTDAESYCMAVNNNAGVANWTVNIAQDSTISVGVGSMSFDAWHHFLVSRSGTAVALYIDGVSKATATRSVSLSPTGNFVIGKRLTEGCGYNGSGVGSYIDELRISKGVAVWSGAGPFTPPSAPF